MNRYLSLATTSCSGRPWIAPVAFAVGGEHCLYFSSDRRSRHASHVATNAAVAASIFDSNALSNEVDGIQISGTCLSTSQPDDLETFLYHRAKKEGRLPESPESVLERWKDQHRGLYAIRVEELFVQDLIAYGQGCIDRRVPADVGSVFNSLAEVTSTGRAGPIS